MNAVDLVVELVAESWSPPYTQPFLIAPARICDRDDPIGTALERGLVHRRSDGVLTPARSHL